MTTPKVGAQIGRLDPQAMLSAVGALHLVPENAAHCLRLEHLAHLSCQAGGADLLSHAAFVALWPSIASSLEPLAGLEDPQESNLVEEIGFGDRVYRVLPGITHENTFILQHLLDALDDHESVPDDVCLVRAVLALSDEIAARAGIDRRTQSESEPGAPIVLPSKDVLERLRSAVVFSEKDLHQIVSPGTSPLDCLSPLTCTSDEVVRGEADPHNGLLLRTPLVRVGETIVCPAPGAVLAALRHAIISRFVSRGAADALAQSFHARIWRTVASALRRCDMDLFRKAPFGPAQDRSLSDAIFAFDRDKVALVTLTTDPLAGYDPGAPFGEWSEPDWSDRLQRRVGARIGEVLTMNPAPNAIHEIHVVQGVGRSALHVGPATDHLAEVAPILMTAAELRLIASVDQGNSLVFWQYAEALERTRRSTVLSATSMLDTYGLYRHYDRSFHVSDKVRPDFLSILPGHGDSLRKELLEKHDVHLRLDPQSGTCVPVARVHPGTGYRSYTIAWPTTQYPCIAVDGYPVPCWIIAINEFAGEDGRLQGLCEELVDALAYWLCELAPRLAPHMAALTGGAGKLEIGVQLEETDAWLDPTNEPAPSDSEAFVATTADPKAGVVMLAFRPPISALGATDDNSGERRVLYYVLQALARSLSAAGVSLSADETNALIEWAAPPGDKRKLTRVDLHVSPDLDARNLRPARSIQPSQVNAALDALGAHLHGARGHPVGAIASADARSVLHDSVEFLYGRLQRLVATLSPRELMEWLVGMHESIARRAAHHRLTLHNRVAAFASDGRMLTNIRDELRDIGEATFASWFVVEYASAMPPRGVRPISLSVYDDLMALATLVIRYGWDCDMVHFGLAEIPLAILPSLRLGADRSRLTEAQMNFVGVFASDYVERARREACFLGQCVGWGLEEGRAASVRAFETFLSDVASALGWERERAERVFTMLCLRRRADFLRPAGGYLRRDVYPWRFERSVSYVTRPLVVRDAGSTREVLWGHRHMFRSIAHWVQMCSGGRGECKSPEMAVWAGRQRHAEGEAFTDAVAAAFTDQVSGRVLKRVRKVGARRLSLDGRDLGDIDVLASRLVQPTIYVVECKALSAARTPDRLQFEIQELFDRSPGATSAVVKLEDKVEWVRRNLDLCAPRLGLRADEAIQIVPLVVLDRELLSRHLVRDKVTAVALSRLSDVLR